MYTYTPNPPQKKPTGQKPTVFWPRGFGSFYFKYFKILKGFRSKTSGFGRLNPHLKGAGTDQNLRFWPLHAVFPASSGPKTFGFRYVCVSRFRSLGPKSPRAVNWFFGPGKHRPTACVLTRPPPCSTQAMGLCFRYSFGCIFDTVFGAVFCDTATVFDTKVSDTVLRIVFILKLCFISTPLLFHRFLKR